MGVLSSFGSFFCLDVLDGQPRRKDPKLAQNLRWATLEYYVYYFVFITIVPLMFKTVVDISSTTHPNYPLYKDLLEPGLIPGRQVDNSDDQYSSFRNQIPTLFFVLFMHQVLREVYEAFSETKSRLTKRINFDFIIGLVFLFALHGTGAFKLLFICMCTYTISKTTKSSLLNPVLTWTTVIGLLFLNEYYQGYTFAAIHHDLAFLDRYSGLLSRWHIHFNFTALRLISYNLDYYWSLKSPRPTSPPASKEEKGKQQKTDALSERGRVEQPVSAELYNFKNFITFVFYTPLYLAGPIITYNNYIHQAERAPSTISLDRTIKYGLRMLVSVVTMELVLHYIYVVAMSKAKAWSNLTPMQISMLGYFNLHIIWLKLLIPWRFFRFWALLDKVETTENMLRCMSNNYSATAFWRAWHRSFNRWIIRYIYIPMGGAKSTIGALINMLAVFSFVAIWHDISLTLLTWGWLVVIFLIPEMVLTVLFKPMRGQSGYRIICGVGAVFNILMMMAANLVGFCVGVDGLRDMIREIFGSASGYIFLLLACLVLFVGVQVMFEVREDEFSRGIELRC